MATVTPQVMAASRVRSNLNGEGVVDNSMEVLVSLFGGLVDCNAIMQRCMGVTLTMANPTPIQDILYIGQRIKQDPAVNPLGAATVKQFNSGAYNYLNEDGTVNGVVIQQMMNDFFAIYNSLVLNYSTLIQYMLNNRQLENYPTTT